jgi:aminoglycoside phosphotransferase (APT) family kinase protein
VERAVFGAVEVASVRRWLAEHVQARVGSALSSVLFSSGRVSAVYGCELDDGRRVVVKVHRGSPDPIGLSAAMDCQLRLFQSGYPCPEPLDGPVTTGGLTATIEGYLAAGTPGDGHDPAVRQALATSLARQIEILHTVAAGSALDPPAWARWRSGPWPEPHDPLFDFSRSSMRWRWVDDFARRAADDLASLEEQCGPRVIGHSDWTCGNVTVTRMGGRVAASYDWDSLTFDAEPVIAGLAAGSHTQGSAKGPETPTPEEVTEFIDHYSAARTVPFLPPQLHAADAAARWVLAYNARCQAALLPHDQDPPANSPLFVLLHSRDR